MLFFLNTIYCLEYYIKDYYMDRYISSEEFNGKAPTFSDKAVPDVFEIDKDLVEGAHGMIKVTNLKYSDHHSFEKQFPETPLTSKPSDFGFSVLDVTKEKGTVIYFPYYDGINQYISLEKGNDENKYRMVHREKCLGFNESIHVFELVDCNDEVLVQWFKLVEPFEKNQIAKQ